MNGLDLFSGIGGISLALRPWVRTVAYCEVDRYCQGVLLSRMQSGQLSCAPVWDDVRTLRSVLLPRIDIITGGFPCQDLSVAGRGAGLAGERSGLVFELLRLVSECRPRFIFLENVPALAVRGLDRLLLELHALGFDARWTIVSAAEMGAPHLRERIWVLAHARSERVRVESNRITQRESSAISFNNGAKEPLANADSPRKSQCTESWNRAGHWTFNGGKALVNAESVGSVEGGLLGGQETQQPLSQFRSEHGSRDLWWTTEPNVGRVVDGLPARVDRIRGLGNAVVPQAAREAFIRLMGLRGAA